MAQYQSFPDASGDSRTLDKLKALQLPRMTGRSFLDVGCNEGFFCGFARYQGADRSVGIDHSAGFVKRARARFPSCEFHEGSWDRLPEGSFDTILLASALHYAEDQEALIHRLIAHLTPEGVLVLELGIASRNRSEWVRVKRGIDERLFPSMAKLKEVLAPYAWKWMGPSVQQPGDPVGRHVIHISKRRPMAYLLMEPPGYGKSSIAASLFGPSPIPTLSGDEVLSKVAKGELPAAPRLQLLAQDEFTPFTLDRLITQIFENGMGKDLVDVWCAAADGKDFALDAFVPSAYQGDVREAVERRGYLAVQLTWERSGASPMPAVVAAEQAEAFYFSLREGVETSASLSAKLPAAVTGFVDEVQFERHEVRIRGWMVSPEGYMPKVIGVRIGKTLHVLDNFEKLQRPDVQQHFQLFHDLLGFSVIIPWSGKRDAVKVSAGADEKSLHGPFASSLTTPGAR